MSTPALRLNGVLFGPGDATAYVTAYGAKGDGTTDDTTAIQNAINAVNATHAGTTSGGTVYFPAGNYKVTSPLNLSGAHNVRLIGAGGLGQGFGGGGTSTPASTLIYGGTGSTSFIQLNSAFGCIIRGLAIIYSSSSFTGILVDYSHATGVGADATYNIIDECLLGASQAGAWNAKALVSWNNADFNVVKNSHLQGAMAGVRFRETNLDYSDSNRVVDCLFRDFQTGHTMNAGNQNVVSGCVFEGNTHQGPPTSAPAYTTDITTDGASLAFMNSGFAFINNALEDYPTGATTFDTSPTSAVAAYGLIFTGNLASDVHFGNLKGATISHNEFSGAVNFDNAGTYVGVSINDNVWFNAVTFTNLPATAYVRGNVRNSLTTTTGDQGRVFGPFVAQHLGAIGPNVGGGTAPGIALSGVVQLGTSPSVLMSGNSSDVAGAIQITVGTTPSAFVADTATDIATVTDHTTWAASPGTVVLTPASNQAALEVAKGTIFYCSFLNGSSSQWVIRAINHSGGTLTGSGVLVFTYVRLQ